MKTMKKENIPTNQTSLKTLVNLNDNQKLPKPLIEKKRRARINRSLSDLRILISDLLKKELTRTRSRRKCGKVEKADVLELAVQYIKEMKQEKSVQKELAFEAGYILCQQNVEDYFRKLKESNSKEIINQKNNLCIDQHSQCKQRVHFVQKDLLKTLDQQWTEYVQSINYNRKIKEQRLSQFDQEKIGNEIISANDFNKHQHITVEQQAFNEKTSGKIFTHPDILSSINQKNFINEKMNTSASKNSYKCQLNDINLTALTNTKKYFSTMWKDKPISKADELISIKMYNEMVMHNLNRNKSICSSASSTSSCSSSSSYAKTVSSLTNNHLSNQMNNHQHSSNSLPHMTTSDLEFSQANYSSPPALCSADSSTQPYSSFESNKEKHESILAKYSNSPFKKRKKVYQHIFDTSSNLADNLWRPW